MVQAYFIAAVAFLVLIAYAYFMTKYGMKKSAELKDAKEVADKLRAELTKVSEQAQSLLRDTIAIQTMDEEQTKETKEKLDEIENLSHTDPAGAFAESLRVLHSRRRAPTGKTPT